MQIQDGRQKNIYNAHISGTNGPIDFISTPTSTISITTYHLDNVTSISIDDVIMRYQDGGQKTFTVLISQETTFWSTSFQRLLSYIDYNLSLGSGYMDKNWWRRNAIPRWLPKNTSGDLSKIPGDLSKLSRDISRSSRDLSKNPGDFMRPQKISRDLSRSSRDLSRNPGELRRSQ